MSRVWTKSSAVTGSPSLHLASGSIRRRTHLVSGQMSGSLVITEGGTVVGGVVVATLPVHAPTMAARTTTWSNRVFTGDTVNPGSRCLERPRAGVGVDPVHHGHERKPGGVGFGDRLPVQRQLRRLLQGDCLHRRGELDSLRRA